MQKLVRIYIAFFCMMFPVLLSAIALDWNDPKWTWMDEQIEEEFQRFTRSGITQQMLDDTISKIPEISFGDALRRYQIINGEVVGPDGEAKDLLKKIAALYPVPNVDVIIHLQDIIWNPWVLPGPVLATCKIKHGSEMVIHFPVQLWEQWGNSFSKIIPSISADSPWEAKIEKFFWRGWCNDDDHYNNPDLWTVRPRGKLCYLSQAYPDAIDAAFSGNHPWMIRPGMLEEFYRFFPKKSASWEEYIAHKYLIDLDGYVASTPGFAWKLLSNCAVFKHDSRFTLWFYKGLTPGVHYIPLKSSLKDIFEKLEWARTHDEEVRQIADNGQNFAKENIMPEHLYLYCYKVLAKYASLQKLKTQNLTPPTEEKPDRKCKKCKRRRKHHAMAASSALSYTQLCKESF